MFKRRSIALILSFFLSAPIGGFSAELEYLGTFVWRDNGQNFGGLSGIEVDQNGEAFWAVSDAGFLFEGRFDRDAEGKINGINEARSRILMFFQTGEPVNAPHSDAEGVARSDAGELFVSFEIVHRVRGIKLEDASTKWIPPHSDFERLQKNSSLEALAVDERGALYMLPERSGEWGRPFPVYRYYNEVWDIPFQIPRRGRFLPVGADFGPDGRLYLLERNFLGIGGFRTRIRAFIIEDDKIASESAVFETETSQHDNLEGISVWRDKTGSVRLTMISDDNFSIFQRTEIVEYRLVN